MDITVIILTKNEERHIRRAIESVKHLANRCVVVDSGSTDETVKVAKQAGATVLTNNWVNHATQFNWALAQISKDTDWILRLDADEIVTEPLGLEIKEKLDMLEHDIKGVYVNRRMTFLGRRIKWGGVFPIRILRLFRYGYGHCENRWMDEHIIVNGRTIAFSGEIIDDNLKPLTWWTEKHNGYASREVVDILNRKYNFMPHETVASLSSGHRSHLKRWLKENVYAHLPSGSRAFAYFFYRYFIRFGYLDGKEGTAFHFLQAFWYRYLVDIKLHEVETYIKENDTDIKTAIHQLLDIDLNNN